MSPPTVQDEVIEQTQTTEGQTQGHDADSHYLSRWPLAFLVMALMASSFMLALDNTILATAIPQITSDFQSLNDIGWYGAAYLITQMSLLPSSGRIYTLFNVKYSFCAALVVFEIGSIVCAAAPTSIVLIVGRAIAGAGAAALLGGATIIISYSVELRQRALVMAMLQTVYGVSSILGPLIGGVITDNKKLTWRFCFWINLPFGALSIAAIWWTLKRPPPAVKGDIPWQSKLQQLDLPGAACLVSSTVLLLLALQWGGIVFPWSDARVYGCLLGFGLILIAFVVLQATSKDSCTIPLALFKNRTMCAACAFIALLQLTMVAQTYYWPIYFQSVKNTSARTSGIYLLPLIVSNTVSTLCTGWIISKIGFYVPFMWIGAPVLAVGSGLYLLMQITSPARQWILYQIVSGIGYGVCAQIPLLSVQVVSNTADVPTACVMVLFFQGLGGALATSIGQNLFTDALLERLRSLPDVDAAAVIKAGARNFRQIVRHELLSQVVEAFQYASKTVFILALASAAGAALISTAMEWRSVPDTGNP
ncbi:MFS general substrate transporter [Setomelanomma holmii]|uniref:MFS general substrate transporter n=1 Tax=Setomelanomma holmii TaxID=210430 RepID=A0A9P4H0P4_9PLEO|nr:MFS general substrate transporter [Setomelanomma holmii]